MSAPTHSAPAMLHSAALPEILSLMTGRNGMPPGTVGLPCQDTPNTSPSPNEFDLSFAAQMADVFGGEHPPEAILLTYRSALPTAPAIRGFCRAAGIPVPLIAPIFVQRETADEYHYYGEDASGLFYKATHLLREELPPNIGSVAIVEQYTFRMQTLHVAGRVAQVCGVEHIKGVNGMWYQDAPRRGIDAFDTFMHSVGHAAFAALTTAERECITAMQPTAATT